MQDFTLLLQKESIDEILKILSQELDNSDEVEFWKEKVIPYTKVILTILIPLKERNLLFTPEGKSVDILDSTLFFRWADLVCLRMLYFIIKQSNEQKELLRTNYQNRNYKSINIEELEKYLLQNRINILDEDILDFPIATYNLHIGIISIIKNLFKN